MASQPAGISPSKEGLDCADCSRESRKVTPGNDPNWKDVCETSSRERSGSNTLPVWSPAVKLSMVPSSGTTIDRGTWRPLRCRVKSNSSAIVRIEA